MKKKGFTLIELLVVIAIIALLMGILMPALIRVRQLAIRMLCGTQLKGIGNAIMVYSNDNDDEYPVAGARMAVWGVVADPFGTSAPHRNPTIAESFYLLVKDGYTTPKQFVCGGDWAEELKFSHYNPIIDEWAAVINFQDPPATYCSYSYHLPYYRMLNVPGFPLSSLSDPQSPLCGDRNPYLDYRATYVDDTSLRQPSISNGEYRDPDLVSSSNAHGREGQNVLFNDYHVAFERHPNVGIDNDNIWVAWPTPSRPANIQIPQGQIRPTVDTIGQVGPRSTKDALLVNDGMGGGGGPPR